MSRSVQQPGAIPQKTIKNRAIFSWHSIRKEPGVMKWKFTYKELTLLIGIVVAVIILITLWVKPLAGESGEVSVKPMKQLAAPAAKIILRKSYVLLDDVLQ